MKKREKQRRDWKERLKKKDERRQSTEVEKGRKEKKKESKMEGKTKISKRGIRHFTAVFTIIKYFSSLYPYITYYFP